MAWLTRAGEGSVDSEMARWNGNTMNGFSEEARAYTAAKQFILTEAKGSFTDASGATQKLFMAKPADLYKPGMYSEFRNNRGYRDYFWIVMGDNMSPDKPTPEEQKVWDARERVRLENAAKGIALSALPGLVAIATGRTAAYRAPESVPTAARGAKAESSVRPASMDPESTLQSSAAFDKFEKSLHGPTRPQTEITYVNQRSEGLSNAPSPSSTRNMLNDPEELDFILGGGKKNWSFYREVESSKGPIEIKSKSYRVDEDAASLLIDEVHVFPTNEPKLKLGFREVKSLFQSVVDDLGTVGFESVTIQGQRISGAKFTNNAANKTQSITLTPKKGNQ